MTAKSSVLYANKPGSKFDLDYYLNTHMPLVAKHWTPYGLKRWEVIQYNTGLEGADASWRIQAILEWENAEAASAATTSDSASIVFGDIPNFTDVQPVYIAGKSVGSG